MAADGPHSILAFSVMKMPSRHLSLRNFSLALLSTMCQVNLQLPAYGRNATRKGTDGELRAAGAAGMERALPDPGAAAAVARVE